MTVSTDVLMSAFPSNDGAPNIVLLRSARLALGRLLFLCLLSSLASPAWCTDKIAVQLSWQHQFQFAGFYLAKERGYYAAAGLDVELRPDGPSALRAVDAVASGRAEFGVSNASLAVDRMSGVPVFALAAVPQSSPAVWLAPGTHVPGDWTPWIHAARLLPFRPADSTELLIPFARLEKERSAVVAGGVALPSPAPGPIKVELRAGHLSRDLYDRATRGDPFTVLDPVELGVDFYSDVLFTSESNLRSRPGTVARFRAVTMRGWAEAFADIEGTAWLVQRLYAPAQALEALIHEGRMLRRLAHTDLVELGHMNRARWQGIGQLQLEPGFGQKPLDVATFVQDGPSAAVEFWPDPVRVTLVGVVVALLISALLLLRVNGRLRRANQALTHADQSQESEGLRFQFLTDVAPFPIAVYAMKDGRVLYANDCALSWSGAAELQDTLIQDWIPALAPNDALAARLQAGGTLREQEVQRPPSANGDSRWCSVTGRAIEYEGRHCAFIAFSDITDRKATEREVMLLSEQRALILHDVEQLQLRLREASLQDALTGLHNRRYFDSTAEREFARCRRAAIPLGLLVIDADHFKKVNDTFGHTGGDEVLKALGTILARSFRTEDLVCRFGGEEFVVLLPGSNAEGTLARAEVLRQAVAECEVPTTAGVARFTVSVGAAIGDPETDTPKSLFDRADRAVYAAKEAGRNCVRMAGGLAA